MNWDISAIYYTCLDINLSGLAPPEREEPANGSSRSTGGVLRGRALGNTYNIGDSLGEVPQDIAPLSSGRVNVTIVQQPPSDAVIENATSLLNVRSPCYDTLGPILKKVAKSYSPVRSKYFIVYKYKSIITFYLRTQLSCLCFRSEAVVYHGALQCCG